MSVVSLTLIALLVGISASVGWLFGRFFYGRLVDWGWRRFHGPERTARARDLATGVAVGFVLLNVPYALMSHPESPEILATVLVATLVPGLAIGAGLWSALAPIDVDGVSAEPGTLIQDHDGFQVILGGRRSGVTALLAGLVPSLCLFAVLAAVLWRLLPIRSTTVRVRGDVLEVSTGYLRPGSPVGDRTRITLPLRGMSVTRGEAADGTPWIRFAHGDQQLQIPVGGHDPAEVAWLVEQLHAASSTAAGLETTPEAPEDLRRILASRARQQEPPA